MSRSSGTSRGRDDADADEERGETLELSVPSMDCSSCATKVESALEETAGVTAVDTRPATGTARVTYDAGRASESAVVAAVAGAGYDVADTASDGDAAVPEAAEVWTSTRALKTWTGAALLVPGLVLAFLLPAWNPTVARALGVEFAVADLLFLAAVAAAGTPVLRSGVASARARSLDIDLLMGTAIVAAVGVGYFEEAATLAVLYSVAELLEEYAMDRARSSLRDLMALSPDEATVVRGDGDSEARSASEQLSGSRPRDEKTLPVDEVRVGDRVVVRPGEKIPMDGVVVEGASAVDESPVTGESVPADKTPGDDVYAGSIAEEGYLEIEVTREADDRTIARVVSMVREAQRGKTEREQFVDRFAGYYTPVVVALAVLTAAVPPLALGAAWRPWFVNGLTLLVISCPCAFVISTPVSVVSGLTSAARNGVLVKGGTHLETLGEVDAVALDKTGTLTTGELGVTGVVPADGYDERDVLRYAAALERRSEHPIAETIAAHADDAGIAVPDASGFESITGRGVSGTIEGRTWYVGKPAVFAERGVDLAAARTADGAPLSEVVADHQADGNTTAVVGTADRAIGTVAVADEVRPEAARAVARLHEQGVERVVMLTGDNQRTARAVAQEVGVDDYRAGLLPDEKVDAVHALADDHGGVVMVGDGVNDAPALAAATVGIAMGAAGTDTALETADVALMGDDLSKLPYLRALSGRAVGVIQQNVWSSLGVKALLAAGVPLGYVGVATAVVVGDMGMSLGVTGNAMRLSQVSPSRFR
jgi:Cd2+/Zn2+-exporting ATPase